VNYGDSIAIKRYVSAPIREGAALAHVSYLQRRFNAPFAPTKLARRRSFPQTTRWRRPVTSIWISSYRTCGVSRYLVAATRRATRTRDTASLETRETSRERSRSVFGSLRRSRSIASAGSAGSRAFARGRPIRRERLPTGIPLRDRYGFFRSTLYTVLCSRKAPLSSSSSLNHSGLTNPRAISILWVHIPPHKYIRADNAPR